MGPGQRRRQRIESEGEAGMNRIIEALNAAAQVSGWKINMHRKHSYELFFVKGKLETVRCTDTCDKLVTVYAAHGDFLGDSQFYVYSSTTDDQLNTMIQEAVGKALLINNQTYTLPGPETGAFTIESNFEDFSVQDLAAKIANAVFDANTVENGSLNSVEIFINRHGDTIVNSRGLHKVQTRYDAMVEAIPTYNGEKQSVELYEQYNFASFDLDTLTREIASQMDAVKARCEAVTPDDIPCCPVVLRTQELSEMFGILIWDLHYSAVHSHCNLHSKGDSIQKDRTGDPIGITLTGRVKGSVRSNAFDGDGLTLASVRLIDDGKVVNYFGGNRYGQYLGETPTGELRCLCLDAGTAEDKDFPVPCLEVVSMSGLQTDAYNDYVGGEIRLAYYHDGEQEIPMTGISISGKLSEVLSCIRLSNRITVRDGYSGPEKAIISKMNIF